MSTAFNVFQDYCALKSHFSSDYDYFRYGGQISAKVSALEKRPDKYYFSKLAKNKNYKEILLANFVERSKWIGDLVEEESEDIFKKWKKKMESLSYCFKTDLGKLDPVFNENFLIKDGQHPKLLTLYLHSLISLETLCILDKIILFHKKWDRQISEKYIWPDISLKIKKYSPFLEIDKDKMRSITRSYFENA